MPPLWKSNPYTSQEKTKITLTFISIGLRDHHDLSLRALQTAKQMDILYAEIYTMKLDTTLEQLSETIGKYVNPLTRGDLEENVKGLIEKAKHNKVGLLVGGDALMATTHVSLLVAARKQGINTRIIHGSSIMTAVAETGLSLYKFGRIVTIPFSDRGPVDTVLRTLNENIEYGLHTLMLLDLDILEGKFLDINQAIRRLEQTETFDMNTLIVGLARLGYDDSIIKADKAENLKNWNFGKAPHAIVVPGKLHFYEEEALKLIASCPQEALKKREVHGELDKLINKYTSGCRRVIEELNLGILPRNITEGKVKEMLDHAERYLDDAEYYRGEKKVVALASVSYAEGILDALNLLGLVKFEW
jgi:diphthine synthase